MMSAHYLRHQHRGDEAASDTAQGRHPVGKVGMVPPPEHVVWRLVRNGHELRAVLRAQPEGVELRQMLDSQVVLRSQLFFLTDVGQAIDEAVTQALELWLSRGWTRVE